MNFEWDEEKNQLNLEKHGIDFETAMLATKTERSIYYDTDSCFG
ncbi:MAG TPA: hypothetical protein DD414_01580 [Lachnospiraceae bacterium]|nr:hypothetical protein [Lachnospiraceae bacterium]